MKLLCFGVYEKGPNQSNKRNHFLYASSRWGGTIFVFILLHLLLIDSILVSIHISSVYY